MPLSQWSIQSYIVYITVGVHYLLLCHDKQHKAYSSTGLLHLDRCLLNKKAHKVMQVMENIFALILKLRVQLVAGSWQMSEDSGQMEHPHYEHMCSTYKSFSEHSRFLYKGKGATSLSVNYPLMSVTYKCFSKHFP